MSGDGRKGDDHVVVDDGGQRTGHTSLEQQEQRMVVELAVAGGEGAG